MSNSRRPNLRHAMSNELRAETPSLDRLIKQAHALSRFDQAIRPLLPEALVDHVRLARIDRERVVFVASSSMVAARLRSLQATLLPSLRHLTEGQMSGAPIQQLIVKVAPALFVQTAQQTGKPLSGAASRALRNAADSLSDSELRALFLDLANQAKP